LKDRGRIMGLFKKREEKKAAISKTEEVKLVFRKEPGNTLFEHAKYLCEWKFPEDKTDREQDLYMHTIDRDIGRLESIEMLDYIISREKDNSYVANEARNRRRQIETGK